MSMENARAFVAKMKEDEAFRQGFVEAGTQAKAMELAKARGFDFTLEEIEQVRQEQTAQMAPGELSGEQLEKMAAGGGWCWDLP